MPTVPSTSTVLPITGPISEVSSRSSNFCDQTAVPDVDRAGDHREAGAADEPLADRQVKHSSHERLLLRRHPSRPPAGR